MKPLCQKLEQKTKMSVLLSVNPRSSPIAIPERQRRSRNRRATPLWVLPPIRTWEQDHTVSQCNECSKPFDG